MRKYTEEELQKYWMALCPACGWKGLACDCNGFGSLGDSGDYDDGYCPMCDEVIDGWDESEITLIDRCLWVWRKISFWVWRSHRRREKDQQRCIDELNSRLDDMGH